MIVTGRDGQLSSSSSSVAQALQLVTAQATTSNIDGHNRLSENLNIFGMFTLMLVLDTPRGARLDQDSETLLSYLGELR